jgi:riboflavin kinase/FMN adenylyltransferase
MEKTLINNLPFTTELIATSGHGRGRKIGIPTFNFLVPQDIPLIHGVYAGWLYVQEKKYPGAIHFGPRPVFQDMKPTIEVNIIQETLPDHHFDRARLTFVAYIRDIQSFPTIDQMMLQIRQDISQITQILQRSGS